MNTELEESARTSAHVSRGRRFGRVLRDGARIALATHALFAMFFLAIDVIGLALFNAASMLLYSSCAVLHRRLGNTLILAVVGLEVTAHAWLATATVGWAAGFHYYLFVFAPLVFINPRWTLWQKIVLLTLSSLAYVEIHQWALVHPASVTLHRMVLSVVHDLNVLAVFGMLAYFAYYFSKSTQQTETQLQRLAATDPLTGLYNRRRMEDAAQHEIAKWHRTHMPLALAMFDVDNFKALNDRYGHAFGDITLRHIGECLRQALRGQDYAARWGGEEFVLLLPETTDEGASEVAERVRKLVSQPIACGEHRVVVTLTGGLTAFRPGDNLKTALARADAALLDGKRAGKNRLHVG